MKFVDALAAVVLGLASVANGHMEMKSPPPFRSKYNPNAGSDIDYSMTSPLSASGSDYPCKGYQKLLGTPAGKSVVTWAPGGSYGFTITGSASHGGGSCQASLSYDKGQTWKVIHSYIGGCPPQEDSNWNFTVPSDAPSGDALFAWTWFNNIGNREMYMNCAAVTIGAGKKRAASTPFASRPDAFVANVGDNVCTFEGKDVEFPQPGPEVSRNSQGTAPPGQGSCSGAPPAGGSSGDPPASQAPPSQPPAATQPQASQPQASQPAATSAPKAPATSIPGGVFITSPTAKPTTLVSVTSVSQPPPPAATSQQPQQPSPAPSPSKAPQPKPSVGSGGSNPPSGSGPSSTAAGSACSDEGQWSCSSDGKQFQRCASGVWSAAIPVAAGTSCQPGTGDSLTMVNKRSGSDFVRRRRFVSKRFQQERGFAV
ncbi:extracellular [Trichoderma arundinaceum]|uniref:Extracellular n=1 Tax=Trichoderma arundinaceum TaxID=490622 RepID=A0A395NI97_TRIAR|nr:extracellular [Trichoderma arundinaceum]